MATVTGMTAEYLETRLGEKVDTAALNELVDDRVSVLLRDGSDSPFAYDDTAGKLVIPSGGGGAAPVDQAAIFSTFGTVKWLASSTDLDWSSIRYNTPGTGLPGSGHPAPTWVTRNLNQLLFTEGWYNVLGFLDIRWAADSDAPESITVYGGGTGSGAAGNSFFAGKRRVTSGTYGFQVHLPIGPIYMRATDYLQLEADISYASASPTVDSSNGSASWTITKLS